MQAIWIAFGSRIVASWPWKHLAIFRAIPEIETTTPVNIGAHGCTVVQRVPLPGYLRQFIDTDAIKEGVILRWIYQIKHKLQFDLKK